MNQGKLKVVKQEMARVNVDILGIIKLKWTGMDEFNSDDHYIYYCRQESLIYIGRQGFFFFFFFPTAELPGKLTRLINWVNFPVDGRGC